VACLGESIGPLDRHSVRVLCDGHDDDSEGTGSGCTQHLWSDSLRDGVLGGVGKVARSDLEHGGAHFRSVIGPNHNQQAGKKIKLV